MHELRIVTTINFISKEYQAVEIVSTAGYMNLTHPPTQFEANLGIPLRQTPNISKFEE
jgi:hypothetical protein